MNEKQAFRKRQYKGKMDPEVVALCDAMNACPGIITNGSCSGHGERPLLIHFYVTDATGLFFLVRCSDRRYWRYGHLWTISLSVGDTVFRAGGKRRHSRLEPPKAGDILPTVYCLESLGWWGRRMTRTVGEKAYQQAQSLVENMLLHLSLDAFMEGYGLDAGRFALRSTK